MKKGLRKSISSIVAAIMLSGSFIFAPIDIPEIGLKDFRFSRDPAAPQVLTYDESTGKYSIDGVESNISNVPTSGDYKLESNVPIKKALSVSSGSLSINLNGYNLEDKCSSEKTLISISGTGTFTLSDPTNSGSVLASSSTNRRAFLIKDSGVLNISGGIIDGFKTSENGAGVNVPESQAAPVFNMSGGIIRNCETSATSGGGGVNVHSGTFTMSGNACITGCKTTCAGADKKGNGAGVNLGSTAKMIMKDHASIIGNRGTGNHGAGIDFWGSNFPNCTLEISGSPVIKDNIGGRGYCCNLYCGKAIKVGDLDLSEGTAQIGITIQQTPTFTIGAKENNSETIEEIASYFFADRMYATDIPNANTYKVEPTADGIELKQTPTITVSMCVPKFTTESQWEVKATAECVPIGYLPQGILDTSKVNYPYHSNVGWNTEPGKFVSNFKADTTTGSSDFNLYQVVVPNKVAGYTLCSFEDGSMGLNAYIIYNEDVGFVDSETVLEVSGFTSNPNDSNSFTMTDVRSIGSNRFAVFTIKFNPYDMTKQLQETITFSNGYSVGTSVQPSNIGKSIVNQSGLFGGNEYKTNLAKQLASTYLVFGECLQKQLGYYVDDGPTYATAGTDGKLKTHDAITSTGTSTAKSVDVGETALTYYGSSVVYNTNIQIKHYVKLNGESASDYTYSIDGEGDYALELDGSGNYAYAKINVPAYMMDHSYVITIKSGSDTVVTVNYSVYNYIDSILSNSAKQGKPVYDTVQALYWYCEDSKAYAGI